ncbi:S-layer protein domain-containing protein [Methanococcoides methylutens]|uniref:S-layer protein domain-containing protein n=1 Tax=Methanococcoides methylutens TaxID=2226 RepID=UPI004044D0A9
MWLLKKGEINIKIKLAKKATLAILLFISLVLSVGVCSADSVTVRGEILDTGNVSSISWDGSNWGALHFALNDAGSNTESVYYENVDTENPAIGAAPSNNVIDKKELIYSTHTYNKKFKLSAKTDATAVSTYSVIPLFGKKYIAVNDDASKMTTLITEQGGGSEKKLREGESWDLGNGYSLKVDQLDADAGKVFVILYKDGIELDSDVLDMDGTDDDRAFIVKDDIAGMEDVVYFATYLENTFKGTSVSFAIIKYTWLIDKDNIISIEEGDKFGLLKCREVSENWINMSNDAVITLEMDDTVYFTDNWYFKTSKAGMGTDGGFLFYPAMNVVFGSVTKTENVVEVPPSTENETETIEETTYEAGPVVVEDETVVSSSASSADVSTIEYGPEEHVQTSENLPGFLSITAVAGLVMSVFSLKRRSD